MTTILHIQSSSNLHTSVTRQIGPQVVEKLRTLHPGATVIKKDLARSPLPHLTPAFLDAVSAGKEDAPEVALSNQQIDELKSSDILVIEAPMYNFGIPSVLKAWIDHIVIAGKTFHYTAQGPEGLVTGKKAILVVGSGGVYSEGPFAVFDHDSTYLRHVLAFIGITDVETIRVEGVAMGAETVAASMEKAQAKIATLR